MFKRGDEVVCIKETDYHRLNEKGKVIATHPSLIDYIAIKCEDLGYVSGWVPAKNYKHIGRNDFVVREPRNLPEGYE